LTLNHFGNSVSGPEKAGVGGSIPSLATNPFNNLAIAKTVKKFHRAHNTRTSVCVTFTFGVARSNNFDISRAVLFVGNVLLRQHRVAFGHLDIRVAQDLCQLVKITSVHQYQDAKVCRRSWKRKSLMLALLAGLRNFLPYVHTLITADKVLSFAS
jgi:hypothetical protein